MLRGLPHAVLIIKQILACSYVPPSDKDVTFAITEYPEFKLPSMIKHRGGVELNPPYWDWIRIETEYDPTFNLLPEDKKETLEDLITTARDYFETTLKVRRLSSLQLSASCKGRGYRYANGSILCTHDCQKRCSGATAPPSASYFGHCSCDNKECETAQGNWGGKLNADFVLFVSIKKGSCGSQTLAYATHCSLDSFTQRPVAGHVNICPEAFFSMKSNEISQWEATIKHELIHAFVFSPSLFPYYREARRDGREHTRTSPMSTVPGVLERVTRMDWETSSGIIPHTVLMMVTPKVREEARKHFECPTLEGAEIENQGGAGSAGSHWEKRVFENEAMSGIATQVYAISRLTLAMFEDSGWYQVNYAKAENMKWGRGLGCKFAMQSCLTWMKSNIANPYPFCTIYEDARCSATRLAKVRCNMVVDPQTIPPEFDYNIKNLYTNKMGQSVAGYGHVEMADYCPYYRVYGEVSREDSDTRCTYPNNMNYNNYSLEVFSPTARCFQLDGGIKVKNDKGTISWLHTVGCYETICKDNRLFIKTQNSKFYPCYHGGQYIHVEKRVHGVGTVTTRIVCPSCTELCGKHYCAPEKAVDERIGDPTRAAIRPLPGVVLLITAFFFIR